MGQIKEQMINEGHLGVESQSEPTLKKPLPIKRVNTECEYCEKKAELFMRVTEDIKDEVGHTVFVCLEHYEAINELD